MEGFFARRDSVIGGRTGAPGPRIEDAHCPLICEALCGPWDAERRVHLGPGYRLTLSMEGTLVKVALWSDEASPTWFWSFTGLDAAVERIEEALREGKGDWRKPKPKR